MSAPAKTYPCPQCGSLNGGTELQVHRGLKCSACGLGYIPVKIEARGREHQEPPAALWVVLSVVAVLLVLIIGWAFGWAWAFWLVPVLLLVAILAAGLAKK